MSGDAPSRSGSSRQIPRGLTNQAATVPQLAASSTRDPLRKRSLEEHHADGRRPLVRAPAHLARPSSPIACRRAMGGFGVAAKRGRTAAAVQPTSDQPVCSATRRVDERDASRGGPNIATNDRKHVRRAVLERVIDRVTGCPQRPLHLVARQHQQPRRDELWSPSQPCCSLPSVSLIPPELALHAAKIVESCLDFDDQQHTGSRVEREQINPGVDPAVRHLDLTGDLPAMVLESALHVRRASCMDEVVWPPLAQEDRGRRDQCEIQPEDIGDPLHVSERRVRRAALDPSDVAA